MSAGRLRVQVPSGPPFLSECSSVFRAPGLGPGGRRWKSCHSDHFQLLPWSKISGIRLLSGIMQVRFLPAAPLPDSVKVARRPVKPSGVGASPTLAAIFGRQADISWLHLSRKQDRHRRGRSITDAFRQMIAVRKDRPVAQKQSTRLITGRRRSVTCQDDQPSLFELRLGEPISPSS